MIRVPFRIDQSSHSAKPVPAFALGSPTRIHRHLAMALPPARNPPNSAYNRDSESDTRAHSPVLPKQPVSQTSHSFLVHWTDRSTAVRARRTPLHEAVTE